MIVDTIDEVQKLHAGCRDEARVEIHGVRDLYAPIEMAMGKVPLFLKTTLAIAGASTRPKYRIECGRTLEANSAGRTIGVAGGSVRCVTGLSTAEACPNASAGNR